MFRRGLVFLVLFSVPAFASDRWQELKSEASGATCRVARVAAAAATKTINVDCTKGDSVQEAIDKNSGAIVVEIRGVCIENVRVENRDVTLHGLSAASDGLQSPNTSPALVCSATRTTRASRTCRSATTPARRCSCSIRSWS